MASDHPDRSDPVGLDPHHDLAARLYEALLASDRLAIGQIYVRALEQMSPVETAERLFGPVLNRIGDGWSAGTVSLAQLYLCGRICEEQIAAMLPETDLAREDAPRIGIATLADRHVLGKRIVTSFLRIAGYPVIDHGAGLQPETLAAAVRRDDLDALLISTLMLPSALKVEHLTALLLDHPVRVFVGGAPFVFDRDLWRLVGAHGVGRDAADALELVRRVERRAP